MNSLFCQNSKTSPFQVSYDYQLENDFINIEFKINQASFNTNPDFSLEHPKYNWGLWDYDVVEFFIQERSAVLNTALPYYEFQSSPLEQNFQLHIIEPRKISSTPLDSHINSFVQKEGKKTKIQMKIDLKNFQNHHDLYAGFFACLGKERNYFTHHQEKLKKIDFHRPELFIKI